jgi:stage II sporulation protein E
VFESVDGMLYSLISDGMGSGREAALTSGICVMFMKRMLSSGAGCPSALKMLNAFLRNRGSGSLHECSATLDAMELDLVSKKASFYKSGAAPSFVVRDGRLYKLSSRTLPLGIIKELDTKRLSFDISEDDIIIMVSDGVTSGRDECPWLSLLIKDNAGKMTTDRLCDLILKKAREENTDDDISVTLIQIKKNN